VKRSLAVLPVLAALALAACGGSDSGADATAEDVAGVAREATGTIAFESWTPTQETMDEIVAAFNKENPDADVTAKLAAYEDYQTSLKTQLASGGGPDVFLVAPGAMFNQFSSFMTPIDELAAKAVGPDWKSRYREETLARATHEGEVLGLPSGYTAAGLMWANKSLLAEHGLEVPTSYDELKAVAATLREDGVSALALGAKDAWQNLDYFMAIANGGGATEQLYAAMEGGGSWQDPALVRAFASWGRLFKDGVLQKGAIGSATYNDTYDLFLAGKAAFLANGSWNMDMFVNSADKIDDLDVEVVGFPAPGATGAAPVTADVEAIIAVNRRSENKAAAFKLAEFMSLGGGAQILMDAFLYYPVASAPMEPKTKLTGDARGVREQIGDLMESNLAGYRQIPEPAVSDALGQALAGVAAGRLSAEEAAEQVQQAAGGA
jgi:raffinose/stachyose/melibiose transport system substrate-binding protein